MQRESIKKEEEENLLARNAWLRQGCLPKGNRREVLTRKFRVSQWKFMFLGGALVVV